MQKKFKLLVAIACCISFIVSAKEISLTAKNGIELKGDYFASETKSRYAVLMLHQCNYNRSMYSSIGELFSKRGINALSIDFRGFGESVNEEFDIDKIQKLPQPERREAWRDMAKHWPNDVLKAYSFLQNKLEGSGKIAVIGASCGGSQAITLAESSDIAALGFFSSAQSDENIERYKSASADKPTLIIVAEQDTRTFESGKTLFDKAQHLQSKLITYKGGEHGYPLLNKDPYLAEDIVDWFESQLKK